MTWWLRGAGQRQGYDKHGALVATRAPSLDFARVHLHERPRNREPQSQAAEAVRSGLARVFALGKSLKNPPVLVGGQVGDHDVGVHLRVARPGAAVSEGGGDQALGLYRTLPAGTSPGAGT